MSEQQGKQQNKQQGQKEAGEQNVSVLMPLSDLVNVATNFDESRAEPGDVPGLDSPREEGLRTLQEEVRERVSYLQELRETVNSEFKQLGQQKNEAHERRNTVETKAAVIRTALKILQTEIQVRESILPRVYERLRTGLEKQQSALEAERQQTAEEVRKKLLDIGFSEGNLDLKNHSKIQEIDAKKEGTNEALQSIEKGKCENEETIDHLKSVVQPLIDNVLV